MSDLRSEYPSDWTFRSLEQLSFQITSGGTPTSGSSRYYVEFGGLPFAKTEDLTRARTKFIDDCELAISDAALRESAAKRYPAGTIFVSMYGTIGLTKIAGVEMAANQALCALMPPFSCDSDYLHHHLEYIRPNWLKHSGQTTQANINGAAVRAHLVPVPSLDEQRKIAQVLDTLDTAIHETEAIIAKLKALKQGLLHDLLTRGIDANGELRPPQAEAPQLYKQSPLGWIPKEWEARPLAKSIQLLSGQHIPSELCNAVSKGVPYFTGPSDFCGAGTVVTLYTSYPQVMCEDGDILITVKGSGCGKVAVASVRACISRQLMAIKVPRQALQYWLAVFQSRQESFNRLATGGNIPGISRTQILELTVASPATLDEMTAIGERIRALDSKLEAEEQGLEKLRLKKSGLMDDLLTGRVRVTPLLAEVGHEKECA